MDNSSNLSPAVREAVGRLEGQAKWDHRFLQMAELVAGWSKDPSTKCGCVIVDWQRRVVSLGYNGFPRKMADHTSFLNDREEKYSRVVHAEMNAILSARAPLDGHTLYIWPLPPCERCAVHVIQAGISRVVCPAVPADKAERWKDSLAKSRAYFDECSVEVTIV